MHLPKPNHKPGANPSFAPNHFANWRLYADAAIIHSTFAGQNGSDTDGLLTVLTPATGFSPRGISQKFGPAESSLASALPAIADIFRLYHASRLTGAGALIFSRYSTSEDSGASQGRHAYFLTHKFNSGQQIEEKLEQVFRGQLDLRFNTARKTHGSFGPRTVTGFVGFECDAANHQTDTGWIRIRVSDHGSQDYPGELQFIDYAYNDSGGPILAGQTTDAVPEPGTAALALPTLRKPRVKVSAE